MGTAQPQPSPGVRRLTGPHVRPKERRPGVLGSSGNQENRDTVRFLSALSSCTQRPDSQQPPAPSLTLGSQPRGQGHGLCSSSVSASETPPPPPPALSCRLGEAGSYLTRGRAWRTATAGHGVATRPVSRNCRAPGLQVPEGSHGRLAQRMGSLDPQSPQHEGPGPGGSGSPAARPVCQVGEGQTRASPPECSRVRAPCRPLNLHRGDVARPRVAPWQRALAWGRALLRQVVQQRPLPSSSEVEGRAPAALGTRDGSDRCGPRHHGGTRGQGAPRGSSWVADCCRARGSPPVLPPRVTRGSLPPVSLCFPVTRLVLMLRQTRWEFASPAPTDGGQGLARGCLQQAVSPPPRTRRSAHMSDTPDI